MSLSLSSNLDGRRGIAPPAEKCASMMHETLVQPKKEVIAQIFACSVDEFDRVYDDTVLIDQGTWAVGARGGETSLNEMRNMHDFLKFQSFSSMFVGCTALSLAPMLRGMITPRLIDVHNELEFGTTRHDMKSSADYYDTVTRNLKVHLRVRPSSGLVSKRDSGCTVM